MSSIATSAILGPLAHKVHYVDAGPWRTRVLEAGEGTPLFLLHGTGGHIEAYSHNIGALSEHFRVVALDFAGHGYTTHATDDLEISAYIDQLLRLMDRLDIDRAHLCGESLGGWVATKFAAAHPDRVERLILNTPGGTMATPEVMERIRSLSQAAADDPSRDRIRARLEWLMASPTTVTEELIDLRQTIYSQPGFARSIKHILCLQDPDIRRSNLIHDEELAAVPNGAMVVWTSDDPSGPASAGMNMANKIPNGHFEYIADAGHWPQWEQADVFNKLVTGFLA